MIFRPVWRRGIPAIDADRPWMAVSVPVVPAILLFLALQISHPSTQALAMPRGVVHEHDEHNEIIFRQKVDSALARVQALLESAKSPRRILSASDVEHEYADKYSLVEFIANTAIAATTNAFDRLGVTSDMWLKLNASSSNQVKLRFESNETCAFLEKKAVEIVDATKHETYETTATGDPQKVEEKKKTTRAVREVIEYHWSYILAYELIAYAGSHPSADDEKFTIQSQSGSETIVVTGSERAPCQPQRPPPPLEVDLGWLVRQIRAEGEQLQSRFKIDRDSSSCKTPRRNDDVQEAVERFEELRQWGWRVSLYFQNTIVQRIMPQYRVQSNEQRKGHNVCDTLRSIDDSAIFVPVLPLFAHDTNNTSTSEVVLSGSDVELLLKEQRRTIEEALDALEEKIHSTNDYGIASSAVVRLILLSKHLSSISLSFDQGANHVEGMLRSQLVSAIGSEIGSKDFDDFVRSFYPKLFKPNYVPELFIYAVRRPNHYPEGTLAIEAAAGTSIGGNDFEPILTSTRKIESTAHMHMPINAATNIELAGEQYLHAWIRHEFGRSDTAQAQLVVRARQFSSFLLVVGNIAGPETFQPKHAIIVQNKDEVFLPLLVEQLPTPKEFRDAIRSLSPEQRDFAKAFRAMQLESSVFAVAIIQLKPQLEDVLGIPYDSLTKEIKLTQNLLELFIRYQVPSDLLSFDGDEAASAAEKLVRVKENVALVQSMIDEAKERELKEAEMKSDMKARGKKYNKMAESRMESMNNFGDDEIIADYFDAMPDMAHAHAQAVPIKPMAARSMQSSVQMASASASFSSEQHLRASKKAGVEESTSLFDEPDDGERANGLGNTVDFSHIAKKLDAAFDAFDTDSALRPTKVTIKETAEWKKNYQKTLLTPQEKTFLSQDDKKHEKDKAFDLLDALSKSGAQPISYSELHVIVAATHRFDSSLIDTVCRSNENPITSIERSALIVSSTIHDLPVTDLLIGKGRLSSIEQHSPGLLDMGKQEPKQKKRVAVEELEPPLL